MNFLTEAPKVQCMMHCKYGFKKDKEGNSICKCEGKNGIKKNFHAKEWHKLTKTVSRIRFPWYEETN